MVKWGRRLPTSRAGKKCPKKVNLNPMAIADTVSETRITSENLWVRATQEIMAIGISSNIRVHKEDTMPHNCHFGVASLVS